MKQSWDSYFMAIVEEVSKKSKDPSSQVGAIIVEPKSNIIVSTGFNGFPRRVDQCQDIIEMNRDGKIRCTVDCKDFEYRETCHLRKREERPVKYFYYEHAERNAIYNAARHGIKVCGCRMYCLRMPCADCARAIIQVGITSLMIAEDQETPQQWVASCTVAKLMLEESGVYITEV